MMDQGTGFVGRGAARASIASALLLCLPAASLQARSAVVQDARLAADQSAEQPAVQVADAERAFDRLDAEAGLRAGGALPFEYQFLAYYPTSETRSSGESVELWTAVSVGADRVREVFDEGWTYHLEMTLELFQADSLVEESAASIRVTRSTPFSPAEKAEQGFPLQALTTLPPGEYRYRIRVRDRGWEADRSLNEVSGTILVPDPVRTQPFLSSIAIAADSLGTWQPAPGLELKLNAARIVYGDARPFVYFEAYGLTPGGDYRGEVRLVSRRVTRGADDVFDGAYQPYQLQYRGSVPDDPRTPVRKVLRLDLGQTQPGPYEVQVRVRDLVTGQASEVRTARLKVREDDTYRPLLPVNRIGVKKDE